MHEYAFVLGRTPYLSISELDAVISRFCPSYTWDQISDEIAIIKTEEALDTKAILSVLGGTIKIGSIHARIPLSASDDEVHTHLSSEKNIQALFPSKEKKIHLGISVYQAGAPSEMIQAWRQIISLFSRRFKSILSEKGHAVGYVTIKERTLSAASIFRNHLLTKGSEIMLIITDTELCIARTSSVQDISFFSLRDAGRPVKDKKSGILPTKISRMMINISRISPPASMIDPCCGSGTIIQEAMLLGYTPIFGSDQSQKAISDTRQNTSWLLSQRILGQHTIQMPTLAVHDATKPFHFMKKKVDLIVTEPYLGPPMFRLPSEKYAISLLSGISGLLSGMIKQFRAILSDDGVIVMIFPAFSFPRRTLHVHLREDLKSRGFQIISPFSQALRGHAYFRGSPPRTIMYGGSSHIVQREILILKKA